jgi:hypothetical protein
VTRNTVNILIGLPAICAVLLCLGCLVPFDFLFQLTCGWALFLMRVLPDVRVDVAGTVTALVCLGGLAVGLHLFLRWLYAQLRMGSLPEGVAVPHWQPRWTGALLSLVVLMFVAGISAVGITHQVVWMVNSQQPLIYRDRNIGPASNRARSSNNLKQIGLASSNYGVGRQGILPRGGTFDVYGNGLHGWQTFLLPYLEQDDLYRQIDFNLPWHNPRNADVFATPVWTYLYPGVEERTDSEDFALSHYASNVRVLGGATGRKIDSITDGLATTILAGEVWANFRPWGYPASWRDPADGIHTTPDSFGSPANRDNTQFLMADGSVRIVSRRVGRDVLAALSTPDGGETIPEGGW